MGSLSLTNASIGDDRACGERCLRETWVNAMPESNDKLEEAIRNPQNLGEMDGADAVGTVGSPDCGDMLRMWVKFREQDGKRVIDKATFQSFGCQTAIAVASVATEMIKGKTVQEALAMDSTALAENPWPPPTDEDSLWATCRECVKGRTFRGAFEVSSRTRAGSTSALARRCHSPRLPSQGQD